MGPANSCEWEAHFIDMGGTYHTAEAIDCKRIADAEGKRAFSKMIFAPQGPCHIRRNPNQRAENGALDPWSLNLRFWAPRSSVQGPQNPYFEGFRSNLGQKSGAPQTQIQRPRIQRPILGPLTKRGREKGDGKENVINCRKLS